MRYSVWRQVAYATASCYRRLTETQTHTQAKLPGHRYFRCERRQGAKTHFVDCIEIPLCSFGVARRTHKSGSSFMKQKLARMLRRKSLLLLSCLENAHMKNDKWVTSNAQYLRKCYMRRIRALTHLGPPFVSRSCIFVSNTVLKLLHHDSLTPSVPKVARPLNSLPKCWTGAFDLDDNKTWLQLELLT